jgi:hypothetical protein
LYGRRRWAQPSLFSALSVSIAASAADICSTIEHSCVSLIDPANLDRPIRRAWPPR